MAERNKLASIPGQPLPERQGNFLSDLWDEAKGSFARYGRRSGAQRDASLAMLNQAVDPNTDPLTGAGMKALGLAGLVTHPLAFFPTREEWDERLTNAGNDSRMSRSIGGFLSDLPSLIDPQMAAGGAALAAAPLVGKLAKPGLGKGLGDLMQDAASNKELDALGARLQAEAAQVGSVPVPLQGFVARNAGENVGSAEVSGITRPNSLYRGMTQSEYDATFGSGGGVGSRGDFSTLNEGTSFADDAGTAESYVNFGRDDPRKTGKPTYLVEIDGTNGAQRTPDGYYKAASTIGRDRVARVFEMTAAPDGSIVARDISSPPLLGKLANKAGDFNEGRVAYRGLTKPYDPSAKGYYQSFTSSADDAREYGENVIAAHLRLGNNLPVSAGGSNFNAIPLDSLPDDLAVKVRQRHGGNTATTDEIAHAARESGYDSVTFQNVHDSKWGERGKAGEARTIDMVFDNNNIRPLQDFKFEQPAQKKVMLSAEEDALLSELFK